MRHLIIILLLSFGSYSQTHGLPFPDSNAVWVQTKTKLYPPGDGPDEYCPFIIYSYDTSHANGMIYNNVYARPSAPEYDVLFDWAWQGQSFDQNIGRFRIDSLKVYYQRLPNYLSGCINGPAYAGYCFDENACYDEFLMYDFGLQVGDTFDLTTDCQVVLNSIDSVLIESNYYRRFNFDQVSCYLGPPYKWIEGIGSSFGFFAYFDSFEQALMFECFQEDPDSTWIYPLFSYSPWYAYPGCQFIGLSENEITSKKELVKITDIIGRETEDQPNTTLIYIYSDGTAEKVHRIE